MVENDHKIDRGNSILLMFSSNFFQINVNTNVGLSSTHDNTIHF